MNTIKDQLPKTFYVLCDGRGLSGYVYGKIAPQHHHEFGGCLVGFGVPGYIVKDGQTVEIYKTKGFLGLKFYLIDGQKRFRIARFDIRS